MRGQRERYPAESALIGELRLDQGGPRVEGRGKRWSEFEEFL